MKKERLNPRSKELLQEMIGMYKPKTVGDIQEMLKDLLGDTLQGIVNTDNLVHTARCFSARCPVIECILSAT